MNLKAHKSNNLADPRKLGKNVLVVVFFVDCVIRSPS